MPIIKQYDNFTEAHLDKSKLKNFGIESNLLDANTVSVFPLYANAIGGIKLTVAEEDREKAIEILGYVSDEEIIACPNCNSTNVYNNFKSFKSFKGLIALIVVLFTGAFPLYWENKTRCKDCGEEF